MDKRKDLSQVGINKLRNRLKVGNCERVKILGLLSPFLKISIIWNLLIIIDFSFPDNVEMALDGGI